MSLHVSCRGGKALLHRLKDTWGLAPAYMQDLEGYPLVVGPSVPRKSAEMMGFFMTISVRVDINMEQSTEGWQSHSNEGIEPPSDYVSSPYEDYFGYQTLNSWGMSSKTTNSFVGSCSAIRGDYRPPVLGCGS